MVRILPEYVLSDVFSGIDMGNGIVRYKAEVDVGKSILLYV